MNSYKKLRKNIGLITIGSFASKILNVIFIPIYTSFLSTSEYGVADIISTTVMLMFPVFTLVICESMMRYSLEDATNSESIYANGVLVWGCGSLLVICLSPLLSLYPPFRGYVVLIVVYYLAYSFYFNLSYFTRGIEKVSLYVIAGVIQTVVAIIANVLLLIVFKMGIKGYLISYVIADSCAAMFLLVGTGAIKNKLSRINGPLLKRMILLALPMVPTQISWWITNSSDKYMLIWISGAAVAGVYSIAYKIPSVLNVLIGIFSSAWRISSVDDFGSEENKRFYNTVFKRYFVLSILVASFLIVANKGIAKLLYSNEFFFAYKYTPFLVLAVLLNGLSDFTGSIYIAAKKTKILFYSTGIGALINIALNVVLILWIGAYGAAISTVVSYFAIWAFRMIYSKRILQLSIDFSMAIGMIVLMIELSLSIIDSWITFGINIVVFLGMCVFFHKTVLEIVSAKNKH